MDTSSPSKMIDVVSQAAAAAAGDEKILRLFYQDLAQPGVKQVGRALSTVLGLGNTVLLPLKMVNDKAKASYAKHMDEYRKNLEKVPEEKIVEVAPEIGVPILEKLEKTTSETISKLYIDLLSNASHIDLAKNAHPRFVSVIESLTRDEAIILEGRASYYYITINSHLKLLYQGKIHHGMTTRVKRGTLYHKPGILEFPENAEFYFDNLRGLGLLDIIEGNRELLINGQSGYEKIKRAFAEELIPREVNQERLEVLEGSYEQTPFCALFRRASSFKKQETDAA